VLALVVNVDSTLTGLSSDVTIETVTIGGSSIGSKGG
jgi:hypothetical protein